MFENLFSSESIKTAIGVAAIILATRGYALYDAHKKRKKKEAIRKKRDSELHPAPVMPGASFAEKIDPFWERFQALLPEIKGIYDGERTQEEFAEMSKKIFILMQEYQFPGGLVFDVQKPGIVFVEEEENDPMVALMYVLCAKAPKEVHDCLHFEIGYRDEEDNLKVIEMPFSLVTKYTRDPATDPKRKKLRHDVVRGASNCVEIIEEWYNDRPLWAYFLKEAGAGAYTLYFENPNGRNEKIYEEGEVDDSIEYVPQSVLDEIIKDYLSKGLIAIDFGGAIGQKNYYLDFLVFDYGKFLESMNQFARSHPETKFYLCESQADSKSTRLG